MRESKRMLRKLPNCSVERKVLTNLAYLINLLGNFRYKIEKVSSWLSLNKNLVLAEPTHLKGFEPIDENT